MSQLDWDSLTEEEKQKVQAYVLSATTEGNPDLPSSVVDAENKALNTEDKSVIGAINEVNWKAQAAYNGTENFNSRFNTVIGDETDSDKETWEQIKQKLGNSLLGALLSAHNEVTEVKSTVEQKPTVVAGTVNVAELTKLLEQNN